MTPEELSVLKEAMDQEELDPAILTDKRLSTALSIATLDGKTGKPVSCLLCEHDRDQIVVLYLVNFSRDADNLLDLFRSFSEAVESEALLDADILFVTMNDSMLKFVQKLLPPEDAPVSEGNVVSGIRMFS